MRQRNTLRRWIFGLCISFAGATQITTVASADWNSFWHNRHVDYSRNNAWPQPFRELSAQQTRSYFQIMTHNGWRAHNSLGAEVFRPEDQMLSLAGRERLKRIVQGNPEDRRVVFVYRADTAQGTEARLAMVRTALQEIIVDGQVPPVVVTDVPPPTHSGNIMAQIQTKRLENLPIPVLPETEESSGTSGQ